MLPLLKSQPPEVSLSACLNLLRGPRDEQRLVGLLIASKLCSTEDHTSVVAVYKAISPHFLTRLLMTGLGKASGGDGDHDDRDAYLKLGIMLLAAFARVPEIASSQDMVSRIPLVMEILSSSTYPSVYHECYEFTSSIATASEDDGISVFYDPAFMRILTAHISGLEDGSKSLELSARLLRLLLNKLPAKIWDSKCLLGISFMVACITELFGRLQSVLKFDMLHMLTGILSSKDVRLFEVLRSSPSVQWGTYIRIGIRQILQSHIVSTEKREALLLAESTMSILGEEWLLGDCKLHGGEQQQLSVDQYLLLVLESARIDVAVLLNEVACLKYEGSKGSSSAPETILMKQQNLAVSYSLIEKIIKLVSNVSESGGNHIKESTLLKVIGGLNETIGLVLDFLQDSKDHGQIRGDDLLASVRIIGCYLAEAPQACEKKTMNLLEYMLSVENEEEFSPFHSIYFLLPLLFQITLETEGCKTLVSFGGHKAVVDCLVKMINHDNFMIENSVALFLPCNVIMNILSNRRLLQACLDAWEFVNLLNALPLWTVKNDDTTISLTVSYICSLIFELTSEESLLRHPCFDSHTLLCLSRVILKSLNQDNSHDAELQNAELHQMLIEGYSNWAGRFPLVRSVVENTKQC